MSYNSDNLAWGTDEYRPAYSLNGGAGGTPLWPAPPAMGASGADWTAWLDVSAPAPATNGYRVWFDSYTQSGGNTPPPKPPKKKN